MDEPTVSVIITTYYRNDRLRAAIVSALEQEYPHVEVIVVDGSGENHAESVVRKFETVQYVPQNENYGLVEDRRVGFEHVSGAYVQFLDDDDRLEPEKFSRQVPILEDDPDVGVVYCGLYRENDENVMSPKPGARRDGFLEYVLRMQQHPCFPSTMLIDRAVLERVMPIPSRYDGVCDVALALELAQRTDFEYVDAPLIVRGAADESMAYTAMAVRARRRLLDDYRDRYDDYPEEVWRTAVAGAYSMEGQVRLQKRAWSPRAIRAFALAAYTTPGVRPDFVGSFLASLFGRRVWKASRSALVNVRKRR